MLHSFFADLNNGKEGSFVNLEKFRRAARRLTNPTGLFMVLGVQAQHELLPEKYRKARQKEHLHCVNLIYASGGHVPISFDGSLAKGGRRK
jgi:hypothetical protein